MARASKIPVQDSSGMVVGYIRRWNGKWYGFEVAAAGTFRCGASSDRTEAIEAVLVSYSRFHPTGTEAQLPYCGSHFWN